MFTDGLGEHPTPLSLGQLSFNVNFLHWRDYEIVTMGESPLWKLRDLPLMLALMSLQFCVCIIYNWCI